MGYQIDAAAWKSLVLNWGEVTAVVHDLVVVWVLLMQEEKRVLERAEKVPRVVEIALPLECLVR